MDIESALLMLEHIEDGMMKLCKDFNDKYSGNKMIAFALYKLLTEEKARASVVNHMIKMYKQNPDMFRDVRFDSTKLGKIITEINIVQQQELTARQAIVLLLKLLEEINEEYLALKSLSNLNIASFLTNALADPLRVTELKTFLDEVTADGYL